MFQVCYKKDSVLVETPDLKKEIMPRKLSSVLIISRRHLAGRDKTAVIRC